MHALYFCCVIVILSFGLRPAAVFCCMAKTGEEKCRGLPARRGAPKQIKPMKTAGEYPEGNGNSRGGKPLEVFCRLIPEGIDFTHKA